LRRGSPGRRLNIAFLCIIFVLTLFAGRLVQLQGLDWSAYRDMAQHQRLRTIPIPAVRGTITSSDDKVLAMTVQTDLVFADPVLMPAARRPAVATALAGLLGMPPEQILHLIEKPSSPQYVVLKKSVPATTGAQITRLGLPGIAETASYTRAYPNGELAANILGYTRVTPGGDLRGKAGLEYSYNSLLAGKDGTERIETGSQGQPIPLTQDKVDPRVPAGNLRLTIQSDLQWEAEQACAQRVRLTHADSCSVVIMQPATGKILAMAQWPTFNPAAPLQNLASAIDIPVASVFEPGSTAKTITVAAALEHGGQTPMSAYKIPNQIFVDGYPFHDAESHPAGLHYTVAGILANSSNVGMVQVVQHVSPRTQYRYFRKFGIGSPTGLGLPGQSSGLLPVPSKWFGDTRYTLSFGQGVAVNAVQMASVYATIANKGIRVQPSIVAGTTSPGGRFAPAARPHGTRVLKAKTAHELMGILQQVPMIDVSGGEPWGVIAGYSIAAKTGTAQMFDPKKGCLCEYGSSYVGIAPAGNPQLVVAVHVQNPRSSSHFGDAVAGPVFNQVMKFALQTMKIPPDGGKPPKVRLTAP